MCDLCQAHLSADGGQVNLSLLEEVEELSSILATDVVSLLTLTVFWHAVRWRICGQGECCRYTEAVRVYFHRPFSTLALGT